MCLNVSLNSYPLTDPALYLLVYQNPLVDLYLWLRDTTTLSSCLSFNVFPLMDWIKLFSCFLHMSLSQSFFLLAQVSSLFTTSLWHFLLPYDLRHSPVELFELILLCFLSTFCILFLTLLFLFLLFFLSMLLYSTSSMVHNMCVKSSAWKPDCICTISVDYL